MFGGHAFPGGTHITVIVVSLHINISLPMTSRLVGVVKGLSVRCYGDTYFPGRINFVHIMISGNVM